MAVSRPHVAFACGFARRNCPHDAMFLDAYQRCFPHCCPRHVDRSYCGGSVYLQVDVTVGDFSDIDDASLCVFAHFHPKAMSGLALGQFVARSMFHENQQTDTNATGEWIGARLMASADHTSWMFEVNPSGRWYYQWESGATKAQRATEHVFEAYVLVVDPILDRSEVVAKTISRDFKMISFRRAPTSEPKPSTPNATVGSPLSTPSGQDQDTKSIVHDDTDPTLLLRWATRDSVDSVKSYDAEFPPPIQTLLPSQRPYRPASFSPSRVDTVHGLRQLPGSSPPAEPGEIASPVDTSPLSLLPSPQIAHISLDLGSLVDFVQTLPFSALELVSHEIRHLVLAPIVGGTRPPSGRLALLIAPSQETSSTPSFPPALASVVLGVLLWVLFDGEFAQAQDMYLAHASMGLLDKVALYESYFAWLERLQQQLHAFLTRTKPTVTLAGLAHDAHQWLTSTGRIPVPSPVTACRGLESFVAQAREVFLSDGEWRRRRPTDNPPMEEVSACNLDSLRLFSAVWVIDFDTIQWHNVTAASSYSSPSAFIVMWVWRQVLGLEFAIDEHAVLPAALTMVSLWNPSRRSASPSSSNSSVKTRGSRFVLDGKPRWLRVFPSGESTSSIELGSQRLGHYVASFRLETRELLVNVYTWPQSQTPSTSSHRDCYCYCLRWCLRLKPDDDTLDVRVAMERGQLQKDADIAALDERSLTYKLRAVDDWSTVASLQYLYRQHRR